MMINVSRISDTVISGSINGVPFSVSYDEQKYKVMKELELQSTIVTTMDELKVIVAEFQPLTKESYKEIVETASPYLFVNKHTNKFYLQYNGILSSKVIPQILVDKILYSVEKDLDITPLIKCWVRFLRNPNFSDDKAYRFAQYITATYTDDVRVTELVEEQGLSHQTALQLATTPQVAITIEGLIVGYKVSEEITTRFILDEDEDIVTKSRYTKSIDPDTGLITYSKPEFVEELLFQPAVMKNRGDEFWCVGVNVNGIPYQKKGHHIRVGAAHFLDSWDQINCNDSATSVKGLHIGGLSYIKGYQNEGTSTHNILVDPADIGAIVSQGDGAMRVKRYFVHSSFAGVNKNIYHSSTYAAMTDQEYKESVEQVVKATQQKHEELDKQLSEVKALV